ncbi:TPR-like protein [Rhodotorula diobovata]|uniref:TPR-like protein n=1 Tax=Rhodotorula diobovata TaxID=5288 RepID=A0A5C5FMZ3_9BASI|nr:TPR-like protein [Rhodotorula diobovata]
MLRTLARSCTRTRTHLCTVAPTLLVPSHLRVVASSTAPPSPSRLTQRFASSTTPHSSTMDPQEVAAQQELDLGTDALSKGDFPTALDHYRKSVGIKQTSIGYYNLGVVQYQLQDLASSIASFESSLAHTPANVRPTLPDPLAPLPPLTPAQVILADTHTNLGAAYILSQPPQPDKALEHLQKALMVNPDDGEVCFNLAAVLEATGELDEALVAYERAHKLGIARADVNIKNVSSKILGKKREEADKAKQAGGATGSVAATDASSA